MPYWHVLATVAVLGRLLCRGGIHFRVELPSPACVARPVWGLVFVRFAGMPMQASYA